MKLHQITSMSHKQHSFCIAAETAMVTVNQAFIFKPDGRIA